MLILLPPSETKRSGGTDAPMTAVFNVFSDEDYGIYAGLLGM